MGFLDHLFDNEWRRRSDINHNRERLSRVNRRNRSRDSKQDRRLDQLEAEVDQLELLVSGLVQTLVTSGTLSREEIDTMITSIRAVSPDELGDDA
ncbi:MAG: hypothetical protein ACYTGX_13980 [Planctomycetota bacterium]|jgi:hypothetical protein